MNDPVADRPDDRELARRREVVADFQRRWWRFARQWRAALRRGPDEAVALVERALAQGLPPVTDGDPQPPPPEVQDDAHRAVVAASGLLDADEYAVQHRLLRRQDPARHFVEIGWRTLRAPSLRFDLWHYWASHLDPTGEEVDPLLHYLLVGRQAGLSPLPEPRALRTPTSYAPGQVVRRACLFAGYDADGLVDDYVVDYLTELARHADVFYLADGVLEPGQLDRLDGVVSGAWSIPHGAYDFGSFSLLARELVGWDRLEEYDEVVLANDSCYLLRPLDDVLAEMDGRACDWWSLQATSMEHDESYVADDAPIALAEAKERFLGRRQWTDVRHLHLSSYFLVFRRPVLDDPGFRWRLDHVARQDDKMLVIHKYEVGISRYLTDAGFDFDTFVQELYAFHPLYSRHFFELVERGFPLVKRNFLGENPRHVLDLEQWPERLTSLLPDLDLTPVRANLDRVSPVDRLHEAHDIRLDTDGRRRLIPRRAVWGGAFRTLDRESPTFDHWWAFVSSPTTGRLDPGVRAVLDAVRDDPSIRKVVLSRSRRLPDAVDGDNLTVLPIHTVDGQHALVRCGRIVVDVEPNVAIDLPLSPSRHDFLHVGIGLPVLAHDASRTPGGEWRKVLATAVTSQADALVRSAGDPDLTLAKAWPTGLPRHDLLVREDLPADLAAEEARVRDLVGDRRLVVWWPHAASGAAYTPDEVDRLACWAREHDVAIGVREARVDRMDGWTRAFLRAGVLSLSARTVPWSTVVHRVASAVVTDRAPEAYDALVTGTPLVVHAPPAAQHGGVDAAHPGDGWASPITVASLDEVLGALGVLADGGWAATPPRAERPGVAPLDGDAAWRFAQRVRALSLR
jgi:Rhamnan synthesis protein F